MKKPPKIDEQVKNDLDALTTPERPYVPFVADRHGKVWLQTSHEDLPGAMAAMIEMLSFVLQPHHCGVRQGHEFDDQGPAVVRYHAVHSFAADGEMRSERSFDMQRRDRHERDMMIVAWVALLFLVGLIAATAITHFLVDR